MIREFILYEQALALKELGFDETCIGFYNIKGISVSDYKVTKLQIDSLGLEKCCLAPLHQQAFRWFREKYGLQSYINPELSFSYNNPKYTVIFIKTTKNFTSYKDDTIWIKESVERKRFSSYEEAELECLKKLIEIVKDK